jgi:outer membrane protein TolC
LRKRVESNHGIVTACGTDRAASEPRLRGSGYVISSNALSTLLAAIAFCAPLLLAQSSMNLTKPDGRESITINLEDALSRAEKYGTQIQSANILMQLAHEDKKQATAATLPAANAFNQFIYTQGNGTPSGVFVANDGVHVYNEQLQVHEELLSLVRRGEVRMAAAAEAVARAKADIAARGLKATVTQDYYAIAAAQHKVTNAERSLNEAREFLDITQKQEHGGEAAHSDIIKAQLQVQQRERDVEDSGLAVQKAKITLAVLIFPSLQLNYTIEDDLGQVALLPPLPELAGQANIGSPDVRFARANVSEARLGVTVARYAYLPSFGLDVFYGIDANQFAARTDHPTGESGRSTLPNYQVPYRQNLGYVAQATLNVPIWNWGATHSRVKQAALKERQATLDLTLTQKQLQADLVSAYQEAQTALSQVASLRSSSELSAQSLRLTILRYKSGEATALEVVDAQTTASQARSAYDDGLLRYRIALTGLQTLTGKF